MREKREENRLRALWERALGAKVSRRSFLKALGLGVGAAAVMPEKTANAGLTWEGFFKKHYKEMTPEDKKVLFAKIEAETKARYGADVNLSDPPPIPGVSFVYCLNLSVCNGSRKCVEACAKENNLPHDPEMQYIKVLEIDRGTLSLEHADLYYDREKVPAPDKFYMPVQCQHCDDPPCTKVCPVEATWKEADGIVVIDYDWCIGCRYCMAACPYEARRFNFTDPIIPPDDINPNQGYLSNRIRPVGVVEKCHFCLHRTRNGQYPACLEACPTGARKFGNILDPKSEVRAVLETKKVYVLKEELKTFPRFYYYFD